MSTSFFTFQQGSDTRSLPPPDSESLRYGRFRAFSPARQQRSLQNLFSAFTDNTQDYGSISLQAEEDDEEEAEEVDERWWPDRLFLSPRRGTVRRIMETWWSRWAVLIVMPAVISIIWCAIPFPTYPLDSAPPPEEYAVRTRVGLSAEQSPWQHIVDAFRNFYDFSILWEIIRSWFDTLRNSIPDLPDNPDLSGPGHGRSERVLNFNFFITVYYGFYNLVGLFWITKVFNMYSLNWWPTLLGFPLSFTIFNLLPLSIGVLLYRSLPGQLITANLTWILLTFATMCCPLFIASISLLFQRRHAHHATPSEVQTLFTFRPSSSLRSRRPLLNHWLRTLTLPRSYKRFLWFSLSLFLTLTALVLGEAYAELYLRTLPHSDLETVIYVWSWVLTIHTLDLTTGWILGARVGSYPLGVVFKLYFNLTYQVYVRALYARLRSPSQFMYLQLLSSSIAILWNPITMTRPFHRLLTLLWLNNQSYAGWKKTVGRSFFVRGLAENVSMLAWLGWVLVLHYGANRKVYPYFAFDDRLGEGESGGYTFSLTFWASLGTWAAELCAAWIVRRVFMWGWGFAVTKEGVRDMVNYPELAPALGVVCLHVLLSMLFSIVRLRFY